MNHEFHSQSPWIKFNETNFDFSKIGIPLVFYPSGIIYFQGELSQEFYFLKSGRVKVFILEDDGTEKILSVHEPGCFFGETSAIDQLPRIANACAMIKSEVISFKLSDLPKMIAQNQDLYHALLRSLSQKIRFLTSQINDMAFLEAEQRIAQMLIKLAADFGIITAEGIKLSISFTDQDLAGLIGSCRVTVTRILNTFKKEGLIKKEYRRITITNQYGLLQYLYNNADKQKNSKTQSILSASNYFGS